MSALNTCFMLAYSQGFAIILEIKTYVVGSHTTRKHIVNDGQKPIWDSLVN